MDRQIIENTLVPHTAFEIAASRISQCYRYAEQSSEPIFLALIGESRTGKTRIINELCATHPPYRTESGLYTPILRIKTPAKPTVKSVVSLMLKAMGDPAFDKGREVEMTTRIEGLMKRCKTRLIVIDEFQHFIDKGTQMVAYHLSDWLKNLLDGNSVGLVVVGLPNCLTVVNQNEQLEGRFLAPIQLYRFDWLNTQHRCEFAGIAKAFHDTLSPHLDLPSLAEPEIAIRLYCAAGGIIGHLAKILREVVWTAIDTSTRHVDLEGLQRAHQATMVWPADLPNPFHRDFLAVCDEGLIRRVQELVGAAKIAPVAKHRKQNPSLTSRAVFGGSK